MENDLSTLAGDLKAISDLSNSGVMVLNPDNEVIYINKLFYNTYGYSTKDITTLKSLYKYVSSINYNNKSTASLDDLQLLDSLKTNDNSLIVNILCKNGLNKLAIFRSIVLSNGEQYFAFDEINKNDSKVMNLDNIIKLLNETVPVPLIMVNKVNQILFVNEQFTDLFGYNLKEVDRENYFNNLCERLIADQNKMNQKKNFCEPSKSDILYNVPTKNGQLVDILYNYKFLENDFLIISFNRLNKNENIIDKIDLSNVFISIIDNIPALIFIKDRSFKYTYINKAYSQIMMLNSENVINKYDKDIYPEDIANQVCRNDELVLNKKMPMQFIETIRINNSYKCFIVYKFPVEIVNRDLSIFGIAINITPRIIAEQKIDKLKNKLKVMIREIEDYRITLDTILKTQTKHKSDFENNIIHQVNKLILPYLEWLKMSHLNSEQKSKLMLALSGINEITSPFSKKLSSKYFKLTPTEIEVAYLVKEGKSTADIADILHVSENAISNHRNKIRNKLEIKNRRINLRSYLESFQNE